MNKIFKNLKENWLNYSIFGLLLIMVFGMLGSGFNSGGYMAKSLANDIAYESSLYGGSRGFVADEVDRKVTKNGNLNLESNNYDSDKQNILSISEKYGVLILSNNERIDYEDYRSLSLNGKIDASKLEVYLDEVKKFGEVKYFNVYSNDMTEGYIDYSKRILRYEKQLEKYTLMLEKDNLEVKDEVEVQTRIDQIEDNLFYLKKNFNNLDERVVYSDVLISLNEERSVLDNVDFIDLDSGFKGFMGSLGAAIWVVIYVLGFVIPFVIVYGVYRLFKRFV